MDPIDPKAKFNRKIGIVSLIALVCMAIYARSNYSPFTAGGAEEDFIYQLVLHTMAFASGLAVIFVIGLAVGINSFVRRSNSNSKWGGITLIIIGIALLILSYTVPKGGDSLIAIQTVPVSLLYMGTGLFLTFKKQK